LSFCTQPSRYNGGDGDDDDDDDEGDIGDENEEEDVSAMTKYRMVCVCGMCIWSFVVCVVVVVSVGSW
jgi:hypothetical protein